MKFQINFALYLANINHIKLKQAAIIISFILHPMIVAPVIFSILIYNNHSGQNANHLFITSFLFSTFFPVITIFFFKKKNLISDLEVSIREQRIQPLVFGTIYFAIGFILLRLQKMYLFLVDLEVEQAMRLLYLNTSLKIKLKMIY